MCVLCVCMRVLCVCVRVCGCSIMQESCIDKPVVSPPTYLAQVKALGGCPCLNEGC